MRQDSAPKRSNFFFLQQPPGDTMQMKDRDYIIQEVISLDRFRKDKRHNASDRFQAGQRIDELVSKYNILTGEVIQCKKKIK